MIQAGSVFTYKGAGHPDTRCIVIDVEEHADETVYHISIINAYARGQRHDILHMPFGEQAFLRSVSAQSDRVEAIRPDMLDGIETWRQQQGGVWDIPISDAVTLTLDRI